MRFLIFILLFVGIGLAQNNNSFPARGTKGVLRMDDNTKALTTIDHAHHEVHEGSHFTFSAFSTIGDADTMMYLIVTPNTTKWAHMIVDVTGALDTKTELFETCTHVAGAFQSDYNNDRNSSDTSMVNIRAVTQDGVTADGTKIFGSHFGIDAGVGAGRVTGGGSDRSEAEWILKQNTSYLVAVISATAANIVSLKLSWYEHTNE